MKRINYKLTDEAIRLTINWEKRKKEFFAFCKANSQRYRNDRTFVEYMFDHYIDTDTPITLRAYSLDADNRRLLLKYLEHRTRDTADLFIEAPDDATYSTVDQEFNIIKELPEPVIVDDGGHTIIWARLRDFEGDVGIRFEKNSRWIRYNHGIVVTPDCSLTKLSTGMDIIMMICERLVDYAVKFYGIQEDSD